MVITLFLITSVSHGQNKIERAKEDLNKSIHGIETTTYPISEGRPTRTSTYSEPSLFEFLITDIALGVVKYGLIGSYRSENHLHHGTTAYPFQQPGKGSYSSETNYPLWRSHIQNRLLYSNNSLIGNEIQASVHPFRYFYWSVNYTALWEFNRLKDETNHLSLFYSHLHYDRIRLERFQLGWKIGISYVGSGVNELGFSYGIQTQYFFKKNYSLAGNATWSRINQQPVNQFDVQIKRHWNNYHLHLGYQHYQIGTPNFRFIGIGGGIYL